MKSSIIYARGGSGTREIEYSIVTPVHNQAQVIERNMASVLANTAGVYEYVVVCDGCEDDSERRVVDLLKNAPGPHKATVISTPASIFETAADNLGFKASSGRYIIEIQADMEVLTPAYNRILAAPCEMLSAVCGVSGRCCHPWRAIGLGFGRLGADFASPDSVDPAHVGKFFVMNTCNRGPLLFVADKLRELGYLDEWNFHLDNSEHDFFARAFLQKGWICGYTPVRVSSPLADGSVRKPRNRANQEILEALRARSNGGFLKANWDRLKDKCAPDVYEL